MKDFPGITVVQTEIAASVPDGLKAAENILQANPDLDAFFAINDPGGLGATQAIKARGLEKQIFVAAVDGDPEAVKLIAAGDVYGFTAAQFGSEIGRQACQAAYDYLTGKTVENHIMVPVMPITIENAADYPGWSGVPPADLTPQWGK
jgi:ribose transport system substrate-binding protein